MRVLVIGGTRFSGRHLVDAALAAGHDVTVFHRGTNTPEGIPGTTDLRGDRDTDLSALAEGQWDATVDMCAYLPRHVRELADVLGGRGGHTTCWCRRSACTGRHSRTASTSTPRPGCPPDRRSPR